MSVVCLHSVWTSEESTSVGQFLTFAQSRKKQLSITLFCAATVEGYWNDSPPCIAIPAPVLMDIGAKGKKPTRDRKKRAKSQNRGWSKKRQTFEVHERPINRIPISSTWRVCVCVCGMIMAEKSERKNWNSARQHLVNIRCGRRSGRRVANITRGQHARALWMI